jgi:hypothetical protein
MSVLSSRAGERIVRSLRKVSRVGLLEIQPVFLHVPKTAGTSLRRMMDLAFWGHPILNVPGGGPRRERIDRMSQSHFDRYSVYRGHFLPEFSRRVRNPFLFTFLRRPEDHLLSYYYHYLSMGMMPSTFEAFLENSSSDNIMTRALAGKPSAEDAIEALAAMDFVGLTEEFEEDTKRLFEALGRKRVPVERWKVTERRPAPDDLPKNVLQAVKRRTREDRKTYDWAVKQRRNRRT